MDLIPRYLQAVRFWLPRQQQDDIIAELSEDIRAQVTERAAELGHPLAEADVEAILRRRGSPIQVANGYQPQQSLIGPTFFPMYILVLKIVTLFSLIPAVVGLMAGIVSRVLGNVAGTGWTPPFAAIAGEFWTGWFSSLAVVTLVFAVLERTPAKTELFAKWSPRKLPPLRPAHSIPRSSSVIEVSVGLCALVWWAANMIGPLNLRFGSLHMALAPVWTWFYWGVLLITVASTAISVANLFRPWWSTERAVARVAVDVTGGVLFCLMFQAHLVASLTWTNATASEAANAVAQLNLWTGRIFPWAIAVTLLTTGIGVWRLVKTLRKTDAGNLRAAAV
ncbi:MAG TPA: hypothetical protein VHX60_14170 [Acidobacteriaceae bacterium]|jgi:hypothetical protein|nr:hypothetical protein [Acidobacteriaceae bacterium]